MRNEDPRLVWTSLTSWDPLRNPVLLTQGAPDFPGSSRLGIEPKT
jgi:hypothetical protein